MVTFDFSFLYHELSCHVCSVFEVCRLFDFSVVNDCSKKCQKWHLAAILSMQIGRPEDSKCGLGTDN